MGPRLSLRSASKPFHSTNFIRSTQFSTMWQLDDRLCSKRKKDLQQAEESPLRPKRRHQKLNRRLKLFLEQPEETIAMHVLVGDEDHGALDFLVSWVHEAAESNQRFGLPRMPLQIHVAHDTTSAAACLQRNSIHLALLSMDLMLMINPASLSGEEAPDIGTVFVVHTTDAEVSMQLDSHSLGEIYQVCGAQDRLEWPPTAESVRRLLQQWMPHTTVDADGTPKVRGRSVEASPVINSPLAKTRAGWQDPMIAERFHNLYLRSPPGASTTLASPPLAFGLRILIVSSCHLTAQILIHHCECFDLWVEHVISVEDAERKLSSDCHPHDLVLLVPDQMGDAYQLAAWWRERSAATASESGSSSPLGNPKASGTAPKTEFVTISALPCVEACAKAGIAYCLSQPVSARCVAFALSHWLDARRGK